jgi:type I restriction enzyme S subunit
MNTVQVVLGDLIAPAPVRRAGDATLPILSMTMRYGLVDQSQKFKKRVASEDLSNYRIVRNGQLVVGFPIDEGVLAFQNAYPEAIVSPAYAIWDVMPQIAVHAPYLGRFLKSPRALSYYKAKLRGSTARRRSLPREVLLELKVPLPPVEEQRRIAAVLDAADALRAKRREALAKLDTLTQAVFIEMFAGGEWPMGRLGDVVGTTSGGTPSRSRADFFAGHIPWVKSGELAQGVVRETEERITEEALAKSSAKVMPPGTVLLAMYGATVGSVGVLGIEAATNQAVCCLTPTDKITGPYLLGLLRSMKRELVAAGAGGAQPNISQTIIRDLKVPVPPVPVQSLYAARAAAIAEQGSQSERSAQALDRLFSSLQQRAFRGKL